MATARGDDDILAVFPEGSTGGGHGLLPIHASLIQAAFAAQAPVQLWLRYLDGNSGAASRTTMDVGDENPVGSSWPTLSPTRGRA